MKVFGNLVLTQKIMLFIIVNRENLTKAGQKDKVVHSNINCT